jgi:hypothetical protein
MRAQEALSALLNFDTSAVSIVSVEAVQWPNACLGVELPGQMCAMHVVDGYRVILEADDRRYEYHTNGDGSSLQPVLALVWHREGGIAGFCDDLIVNVVGEAAAWSCRGALPTENSFALLKAQQRTELDNWLSTLRPFTVEYTDPAVADAMTTRLVFSGWGTAEASDAQKQAIEKSAAGLYAEIGETPVLPELDNALQIKEIQVDSDQITVSGTSTLPDGTCVLTSLRANGQAQQRWPADACATVRQGAWQIVVPWGQGSAPAQLDMNWMYEIRAWPQGMPSTSVVFPFDLAGPPTPRPEE